LLQACEGLIEAHSLGIVHRDLKPENLFLAITPEGVVLKILDFGISKDLGSVIREGRRTTLTKGGAAIGSPSYMAPEQIRAEPNLDARADIWSLGTILFELLTGRCPFQAETVALMYQRVLNEPAPSLLDFLPDAPHELNTIIQLCLRKDADDRFQSVQELATALRGVARPPDVKRARVESGVSLISEVPARPPGVSLPIKLGLLATTTLLMVATIAFWQLQIRSTVQRPASISHPSSASVAPTNVPPAPTPITQTTAATAVEGVRVEKPEPRDRPEPAPRWPAPSRRPAPPSAGARYGL
jgi:serine/threonine-protein kinase